MVVDGSIGSPVLWIGFTAFILAMLALDLGVFHRKAHVVRLKEAAIWSGIWVSLALAFNGWVYWYYGSQKGLEFTTGYLIEKSLAVDNIFVFAVIFSYFAVPPAYQHRVLFWGILGALVMRAIFIFAGAALLSAFHWIIYIFGAFLILTGIKILAKRNEHMDPGKNPVLRLFQRFVPMTDQYHGQKFTIVQAGKRLATPLLAVLVLVEVTDLVFAVDSIPAIFAITDDPFIVYTSNIFAILGLRSMYFLLAGVIDRFRYLKIGLGAVLVFVGTKMVLVDIYKVPTVVSLAVIASLIAGSIVISLIRTRQETQSAVRDDRSGQGQGIDTDHASPSADSRTLSAGSNGDD
jgi:tellurite resistance protein TerC